MTPDVFLMVWVGALILAHHIYLTGERELGNPPMGLHAATAVTGVALPLRAFVRAGSGPDAAAALFGLAVVLWLAHYMGAEPGPGRPDTYAEPRGDGGG